MKPTKKRSLPLFWRLTALITGFWFLLVTASTTVTLRYSLQALLEQITYACTPGDQLRATVYRDGREFTPERHIGPEVLDEIAAWIMAQ